MTYYNKQTKFWLAKQFYEDIDEYMDYDDDTDYYQYGDILDSASYIQNISSTNYNKMSRKPSKIKWTTFVHNGVMFPKPYSSHGLPVIYNSEEVYFENKLAEEYATLYAKYYETEYVTNKTFNKNFWKDWKKILGKNHKIKDLEGCDFSKIYNYLVEEKMKKNDMTKEEKEKEKAEKEIRTEKYRFAWVDGIKQPVSNFRVEPPGLFIGRGCHPKLGSIKRRIYPRDITLNLSKDAPIPVLQPFYEGMVWGDIIHDKTLEWLASWKDEITNKMKYVWLGAHSHLRTQSDLAKFELARQLKKKIRKIRRKNDDNLESGDMKKRQIATAVYFIDNFALRVGNEKGSDAADTVGVTSLRVEHIELLNDLKVKLDFLGKDSIRYVNKVKVSKQVYDNLGKFKQGKDKKEDLFDLITSNDVNKYLRKFMRGLTAKVFRTLNASYHFQKELKNITNKYKDYEQDDKVNILLNEFNKANTKIAALCNHQKKVSKTHNKQVDVIDKRIKDYKKKLRKLKASTSKSGTKGVRIEKMREKIKKLRAKKSLKIEQKNLSLGTSKINYIDPRITVAFMKKHNVDVDKVFSKTLQSKFIWAFDIDENFRF